VCLRESTARLAKSGLGASNRDVPRDRRTSRLHALSMRWVLMLGGVLAAVRGGEAWAVVVIGRAVVSEWDGEVEATRLGGRAGARTERGDADGAGELAAGEVLEA